MCELIYVIFIVFPHFLSLNVTSFYGNYDTKNEAFIARRRENQYLFTRFIKLVNPLYNNSGEPKTTILMVAHIRNNHRCNNLLFRCFVDGKGLYRKRVHRGSRRVNRVEIVLDERAEGRRGGGGRGMREVGGLEETAGRATVRYEKFTTHRPDC